MKFISCHVENFGKLADFSFEFSEGTNVICEENGWGKSTFAAFIRAMFYGLEGEHKRNPLENERKKYKPWQGGAFGGWLVFEIQGRQYQISRIFHDKEKNDEFELRDAKTNLPSKDYSKKIGEEIFQIDRESFLRTVFIGQNECETSPTDDINAKIGSLADNANDLNRFDAAYARLTEIVNALTPQRASGALAKRREEIARCERIFKEGEGILQKMELSRGEAREREERYHTLKEKLSQAAKLQERVLKSQSVFAERTEWARLKHAAAEKAEAYEAAMEKFPGEIPALLQVKEQIARCAELGRAYERVSLYRMDREEERTLSALEEAFYDGVPGAGEFEENQKKVSELLRLSREFDAGQMSRAERERFTQLAPRFLQETESVASVAANWAQRNQKKAALPSGQAALTALQAAFRAQNKQNGQNGKNARPKRYGFLFFTGILLAAAGIAVAAMLSTAAGIGAAVLGAVLILAGAWKKMGVPGADGAWEETGNPEIARLSEQIEEDTALIRRVDEETAAYLRAHGREFTGRSEHEVTLALQEIAMENAEYQALKRKEQCAMEGEGAERIRRYQKEIEAFFKRYGGAAPQAHYEEGLYALKERAATYTALAEKREKFRKAEAAYEQIRSGIAAFYKEYGFVPEQNISLQLNDIRDAVYDYEDAKEACDCAAAELSEFEAEHDIAGLEAAGEAENLPSFEEIHETVLAWNEEIERVRDEQTAGQKAMEDLREAYDEWEENRVKLEQLREMQEIQQKKYELVFAARAKLAQAKEAMTAKYAAPILEGFGKYYELITRKPAKHFRVDANTAVTVEAYGKQREVDTLSRGWRDLAGICLRIAFADAMYPGEAPVLILDDPFTNFDDEKIAAGRDFLAEVSKKYQVVYFTCSKARDMEKAGAR